MRVEEKEALFVVEYMKDFNQAQAAIRAGFSPNRARQTGYDLMQKPEIREAVQKEMRKRISKIKIDVDYVTHSIVETVERCKQAHPVLDKKGDPILVEDPISGDVVPAYEFNPAAVLKGCELLGRHLKMFTDKLELSGNVGLAEKLKAARKRIK